MPGVNLIPMDIQRARLRRQRIRFWMIAAGLAWLIAAGPVAKEVAARHHLRSQQAAVAAISSELHDSQDRCAKNAQRLKDLKEQFARAARLRYKRPWTALISVVTESVPPRAWLTSFATDPPRPPAATPGLPSAVEIPEGPGSGAGQPARYDSLVGKAGPRRILVEGRALGLEDIYSFADALQKLETFNSVGIRTVSAETVDDLKITRFVLECDW